jgi:hypothetical protein
VVIPRGYCLYIPITQSADFKDGTGRILFASPRSEAELKRLREFSSHEFIADFPARHQNTAKKTDGVFISHPVR